MSLQTPRLVDSTPGPDTFRADVLRGLLATPKTLPCQYFYDDEGSRLFEAICDLDEYYLTRSEIEILRRHGDEIAACFGSGCRIVEYGSGSSKKTRLVLERLRDPVAYVSVDISRDVLVRAAHGIAQRWPRLEVLPVAADYTRPFRLPATRGLPQRTVVFFPGSTIGNFHAADAQELLAGMAKVAGPDGGVIVGMDLEKDPQILERAYDDARGVTAAFNKNLLRRINEELGADFDLDAFRHWARWNPEYKRIEMHLVSNRAQRVHIDDTPVVFAAGETIHTESSYKYSAARFAAIAAAAGLTPQRMWTDARGWFGVQHLTVAA